MQSAPPPHTEPGGGKGEGSKSFQEIHSLVSFFSCDVRHYCGNIPGELKHSGVRYVLSIFYYMFISCHFFLFVVKGQMEVCVG